MEVVDLGVEVGEMLLAARAPKRPFVSVALGEREVEAVVALTHCVVVRGERKPLAWRKRGSSRAS